LNGFHLFTVVFSALQKEIQQQIKLINQGFIGHFNIIIRIIKRTESPSYHRTLKELVMLNLTLWRLDWGQIWLLSSTYEL